MISLMVSSISFGFKCAINFRRVPQLLHIPCQQAGAVVFGTDEHILIHGCKKSLR